MPSPLRSARPFRVVLRPPPVPALLGALTLLSCLHAADAPRATFKFATQTLSVPAGFIVEQVAAPPLVNRPISIAFDPEGRLYATDSSGLSDRAPVQFEQKPHRIVRLEDTDGDGSYDKSTVFAENMMFPQGALFHEGSLYVGAPPHIWKLTDTDGDGVADERVAWYDGKTLTGCANDLHGPYLGPDGWFYWTKGAFAEQTHPLPNGRTLVSRASHIFRARPDGSGREPVLTGGMDNPVGVAFTGTGERILSGTFFQVGTPGKRDGLIHALYGGVYGKDQAAIVGHTRTGDLLPIMTHMGAAAPCGSTAYRSGHFGAEFSDNLFVCYFNLRKVSRHQLAPDGATFATTDTDFVTSDHPDFRPTDVLEDADGSLLVVDTGGWYKICCPTSQLAKPDILGAIYRVRRSGALKTADPRGLNIRWPNRSPADLAKLLGDPRPYVVDRAMHELGRKGPAVVPALQTHALRAAAPAARRAGLWTLGRLDHADARAAARAALADHDPSVVHTALQVVGLHRDADAAPALMRLLGHADAQIVRLAAEALGRIGAPTAPPALLAAAARLVTAGAPAPATSVTGTPEAPGLRTLEHALIYALIEIGRPAELFAALAADSSVATIRVALVALDQMPDSGLKPEQVLPFLTATTPSLRRTAGWIVSHRPEWGDALAGYYRSRLATPPAAGDDAASLETQLTQLAKAPQIQELLAATAQTAGAPAAARLLALRAMGGAALKEVPARWFDVLAGLIASPTEPALARQAVATTRGLTLPKVTPPALVRALAELGRTATQPADLRLEALSIAPAALGAVEPAVFAFLRAHLAATQPLLLRAYAATTLARAPLSGTQQLALADALRTVGAIEAPKLLPAFERAANDALGARLLAALQDSPARAGLRGNVLQPVLAKYSPEIRARGQALIASLNANAAQENARVAELLAFAQQGDVRRGQAVFNSEKTACLLCHQSGHAGGKFGPDLTNIGRIRDERELLEAIVFPSATFVRGFEPMIATLHSGDVHSGILRKDAPEEIVLATGPDTEQRLARAAVKELQPGTLSPMPPGMDAVLTPQELGDLVAFLKSRQ
jgi:putative membrane-bound dehydrogenase-like protein